MAERYEQSRKDEVVAFIEQYNAEHGRGGQSAASKKFGINPITIKSWLEKAGVKTPGKRGKKKTGKKSSATSATSVSSATPAASAESAPKAARSDSRPEGGIAETLGRMADIQREIEKLQSEYEDLKTKI